MANNDLQKRLELHQIVKFIHIMCCHISRVRMEISGVSTLQSTRTGAIPRIIFQTFACSALCSTTLCCATHNCLALRSSAISCSGIRRSALCNPIFCYSSLICWTLRCSAISFSARMGKTLGHSVSVCVCVYV